jgi:hypothetical protein
MWGVAEIAVRVLHPTPRLQMVRFDATETLSVKRDRVVWTLREPEIMAHGCTPGTTDLRVAFAGSSIFRGSGVSGEETFTTALQQRADGWCIDNVSQPAFTAGQKHVVAMDLLEASEPPDLLFWEVWTNDLDGYVLLEDGAYNLLHHTLDSDGTPNAFGLPATANRALFGLSKLYAYATLAVGSSRGDDVDLAKAWDAMLRDQLEPVVTRAAEVGTTVVLVLCPRLDRPFAQSASRPPRIYGRIWPFAQRHGLRWIRLSERLEGQPVETLRVDTCCHYAAAGHAALADLFEAEIRRASAPAETE